MVAHSYWRALKIRESVSPASNERGAIGIDFPKFQAGLIRSEQQMAKPTNIFINDISIPEADVVVRDVVSESERRKSDLKNEQAYKGLVSITMDAGRRESMRSLRQTSGDVTFKAELGNEQVELKYGRITQVRNDGEGKIKVILAVPFAMEQA